MASFRLRGTRWQARVQRNGFPPEVQTFVTRQDAEKWARSIEVDMDRGLYISSSEAQRTTMAFLIDKYCREVLPRMKGEKEDRIRLMAIRRHKICSIPLTQLTPSVLGKYRDERLEKVSSGTVIREFAYFSSIINLARKEWGINLENPVSKVRKPLSPQGRNRVLSKLERAELLLAVKPQGRRSPWLEPVVIFALETGMRRSEILSLRWKDIDFTKRLASLEMTKNGERRVVPLSSIAIANIDRLPRSIDGKIFPISAYALAACFNRAIKRAGIEDFRFHDLRHTAITQLAEKLPNLIELAAVTGHKSLKMLQRYYHPNPEDLAIKIG